MGCCSIALPSSWKVIAFTVSMILGLTLSQIAGAFMENHAYDIWAEIVAAFTMWTLSFIMINVGYEFTIDKDNLREYGYDYLIAMTAAGFPWMFVGLWFYFAMDVDLKFEDALLIARFAAPTSAGILFSMLDAAGLKDSWVFEKARILAIFDDLDTIILMIPLKVVMVGFKWELIIVILLMAILLAASWVFLHKLRLPYSWPWGLLYAAVIAAFCKILHYGTHHWLHIEPIHLEVLLPAFVLGTLVDTPAARYELELQRRLSREHAIKRERMSNRSRASDDLSIIEMEGEPSEPGDDKIAPAMDCNVYTNGLQEAADPLKWSNGESLCPPDNGEISNGKMELNGNTAKQKSAVMPEELRRPSREEPATVQADTLPESLLPDTLPESLLPTPQSQSHTKSPGCHSTRTCSEISEEGRSLSKESKESKDRKQHPPSSAGSSVPSRSTSREAIRRARAPETAWNEPGQPTVRLALPGVRDLRQASKQSATSNLSRRSDGSTMSRSRPLTRYGAPIDEVRSYSKDVRNFSNESVTSDHKSSRFTELSAKIAEHLTSWEEIVQTSISLAFMALVGLSMPALLGKNAEEQGEELGADLIVFHVAMVSILMILGKMFPMVCYRDDVNLKSRTALCLGMCPRGEVGASIIVISLDLGVSGPSIIIAMCALAGNLVMSGGFIAIVKYLLRNEASMHSDEDILQTPVQEAALGITVIAPAEEHGD